MPTHAAADDPASTSRDGDAPDTVELVVDLLTSLGLVLVGGLAAVGGYLLADGASRELSSDIVAEMGTRSTFLTTAELVDAVYATMVWGGRGLVASGVLLAVAGVAFLVYSGRVRGQTPTTEHGLRSDGVTAVVYGALATVVTSFVPFSPVVGGAVAGYLHRAGGAAGVKVGAGAGLALATPVTIFLGALAVGLVGSGATSVGAVVAVGALISLITVVGLSALGGYLGDHLAHRSGA